MTSESKGQHVDNRTGIMMATCGKNCMHGRYKMKCSHPWRNLTMIYKDNLIQQIGCGKCNEWLYPLSKKPTLGNKSP